MPLYQFSRILLKKQFSEITTYVRILISLTVLLLLRFRSFLIFSNNLSVSILTPGLSRDGVAGSLIQQAYRSACDKTAARYPQGRESGTVEPPSLGDPCSTPRPFTYPRCTSMCV